MRVSEPPSQMGVAVSVARQAQASVDITMKMASGWL